MIGDLIGIFKARRDPATASRLAAKFAAGAAIERLSWPLVIAKFWMAVLLVACAALVALSVYGGAQWHWSAALPALLPAAMGYAVFRIWRGLNRGVDIVSAKVEHLTERGIGSVERRIIKPSVE